MEISIFFLRLKMIIYSNLKVSIFLGDVRFFAQSSFFSSPKKFSIRARRLIYSA